MSHRDSLLQQHHPYELPDDEDDDDDESSERRDDDCSTVASLAPAPVPPSFSEHVEAASEDGSEAGGDEETEDDCPLCMEPFDATDREFTPCRCGYKICLWCWHNLNNIYTNANPPPPASAAAPQSAPSALSASSSSAADRPPLAGRCPACRQPYVYPDRLFNADTLHSSLSNKQRKSRDKQQQQQQQQQPLQPPQQGKRGSSSVSISSSSAPSQLQRSLTNAEENKASHQALRVLQRNLMYVINVPAALAKEELLQERRYFGKFGKIIKLAITRKPAAAAAAATFSTYVTFKRAAECATAIALCHHTVLLGHVLKATYGTTKYCAFYVRGVPCTNQKCQYLHEAARSEDLVSKDELAAMERKGTGEKPTPFPMHLTVGEALAAAKASRAVQPADEGEVHDGGKGPSAVPSATASTAAAPLLSVWNARAALPASALFSGPASSSASSVASAVSLASIPSIVSAAAHAPLSAGAAPSGAGSSNILRPYVSILAQSQTATHPPSAAALPAAPAPSNEIIRIVPAFLKDKFPSSTQPTAGPAASGKRKGAGAGTSGAATSAAAAAAVVTASTTVPQPSMSRSSSKASSTSSRASSPISSPVLQPVSPSLPVQAPPAIASAPQSPVPPFSPSSSSSVAAGSAARSGLPSTPSLSSLLPPPPAPEEDFDFLLFSRCDFSPFFAAHALHDPLFSWLCEQPHTASSSTARRLPDSGRSRFDFAQQPEDADEQLPSTAEDARDGRAPRAHKVDGQWDEQKAAGAAPVQQQQQPSIQAVSSSRAR